ncbi:MAG: carboxymuconolactone decarboxylase family protein [Thermoleophilia bacterium]|nr:carboxymuconolactone decarboxylase family protein [Thermoleophilia bacterium]
MSAGGRDTTLGDDDQRPERSDRWHRGWEQLTRLNGTTDPKVVRRIEELSPDLARMIVEFGYGEAYADRPMDVLDEQQRQLVTIGALAAMGGCDDQLAVHARVAINAGLAPAQVIEAILHALPYIGFPRTINALEAVRRVLERGRDRPGTAPT